MAKSRYWILQSEKNKGGTRGYAKTRSAPWGHDATWKEADGAGDWSDAPDAVVTAYDTAAEAQEDFDYDSDGYSSLGRSSIGDFVGDEPDEGDGILLTLGGSGSGSGSGTGTGTGSHYTSFRGAAATQCGGNPRSLTEAERTLGMGETSCTAGELSPLTLIPSVF